MDTEQNERSEEMNDYSPASVRLTLNPVTLEKIIHSQRERYDRKMQPGRHTGMLEPVELNTIITMLDVQDALNRLPWREWKALERCYYDGEIYDPSGIVMLMEQYGFCDEEKLQNWIKAICRKVARWASGRYKDGKKPDVKRNYGAFDEL
jgi:hypothetical protein